MVIVKAMRVADFRRLVAEREGKKESMTIAQISEVLRIVNELLGGALYRLIRTL